MSLLFAHVGKPRLPFVRQGIEHFLDKIQPLAGIRLLPVREEPLRKGTPAAALLRRERERILQILDRRYLWVVLSEKGRSYSSPELARLLEGWLLQGRSRIGFLVAGPLGLAPELLEGADLVLSLSPLTLSHEMTVLVLLEQIYRALAVLNRLPYPR